MGGNDADDFVLGMGAKWRATLAGAERPAYLAVYSVVCLAGRPYRQGRQTGDCNE